MGLEFKPYFSWEEEEEQGRHVSKPQQCGDGEKQTTTSMSTSTTTTTSRDNNRYIGEPVSEPESRSVTAGSRELVPASLAAVNSENREYAVLVASEEEDVNEYKSFFSIVLDYPQFLGQGETKESALRQASRLLHYAFGSMVLKNEAIPAPSDATQVEAKKVAMERDWQMVKLENFSMELVPLQFQSDIDYTARPPESDGEYEIDHEDEELFELENRMSTP